MIFQTQDGSHSIFSPQFNVSYHSKYGAIQESDHVFIQAGLRLKAVLLQQIDLLEIGFGTGLNALMTYWEAQKRGLQIHYVGVEGFPLDMPTIEGLNYCEALQIPNFQPFFLKMHQTEWGKHFQLTDDFSILKLNMIFQNINFQNNFDLIYYDAFAPTSQPELWEPPMLQKMYDALRPDGVLVTYCAKGSFKRNLKTVGFSIEALPGPKGKREMTRASKLMDK